MKSKRVLSLLFGMAGLVATSLSTPAAAAPFEVGKPFPDLILPDLREGTPTSLQQFRGRPLVLHVFASW